MKNVHLLPTDKLIKSAGDLVKDKYGSIHIFTKNDGKEYGKTTTKLNIYITSDEEIKDWFIYKTENKAVILKAKNINSDTITVDSHIEVGTWVSLKYCKKIILTTDDRLIKDGVQPIDDEFLEWFVKNPSCEFVDTFIDAMGCAIEHCNANPCINYKIIIPQEELKQETIQLFIEKHGITEQQLIDGYKQGLDLIFKNASKITKQETLEEVVKPIGDFIIANATAIRGSDGAYYHYSDVCKLLRLQSERMYSEEDLREAFKAGEDSKEDEINGDGETSFNEWFEQFKKK